MMPRQNSIISLNDTEKKHQVVYRQERSIVDEFGEVKETDNIVIRKENTKDDFLKLFVDNLEYFLKLENSEKNLFFILLTNVNYKNIVLFNRSFRKSIVEKKVLTKTTLYRAFNGLLDKKVIYKVNKSEIQEIATDEAYILNPDLVGKGSFRDLKKLRHTLVTDYDFETLEVKTQIINETIYDGLDDIISDPNNHEVKSITQDTERNETEILVSKKNSEFVDVEVENDKDVPIINMAIKEPSLFDNINDKPIRMNNILKSTNIEDYEIEISNLELELANIELEKAKLKQAKITLSDENFEYKMAELNVNEAQIKLKIKKNIKNVKLNYNLKENNISD